MRYFAVVSYRGTNYCGWQKQTVSKLPTIEETIEQVLGRILSQEIKMFAAFYYCCSIESLPDISNWNLHNVTDLSYFFYKCSSLKSLPDISKWNTEKVIYINELFSGCSSLKCLPDISKWNTRNIKNMKGVFLNCT